MGEKRSMELKFLRHGYEKNKESKLCGQSQQRAGSEERNKNCFKRMFSITKYFMRINGQENTSI